MSKSEERDQGVPRGPGGRPTLNQRGSALLMVLWISAALAALGFSLANTVRGETERTSTSVDGLRAYYLAVGGVERAELEVLWSVQYPDKRPLPQGTTRVDYNFPSGLVHVEIIPETAKLNVNSAPVGDLFRVMQGLGIQPDRAREIAMAIDDWRKPPAGGISPFDAYYFEQIPSFRSPHASFQEIEELLLVKGVTPDIFYGTYVPAAAGETAAGGPRLLARTGLVDCLSVYGSDNTVDINTATPAVLAAVGVNPYTINAILERRTRLPFKEGDLAGFLRSMGGGPARVRVEGNSIVTFRATAQLRLPDGHLSDLKRTVAAQVKYGQPGSDTAINVLRWYDTAWSN